MLRFSALSRCFRSTLVYLKKIIEAAARAIRTILMAIIITSIPVLALLRPNEVRIITMNKKHSSRETRVIEARISRSLRIAVAAALVIALVIPIAENALITSNTGKAMMRLADMTALLTMLWSLANAFLLDRRLKACHLRLMEQLRAEAKGQRHKL